MMTEFTPGPWLIEYDNHGNGDFSEWWNVGPAKVAIQQRNKDQAALDASLIAAAPDLLAALEDARPVVLNAIDQTNQSAKHETRRLILSVVDAAIARARGE